MRGTSEDTLILRLPNTENSTVTQSPLMGECVDCRQSLLRKAPANGQEALDTSVPVKTTSPRRVGVDPQTAICFVTKAICFVIKPNCFATGAYSFVTKDILFREESMWFCDQANSFCDRSILFGHKNISFSGQRKLFCDQTILFHNQLKSFACGTMRLRDLDDMPAYHESASIACGPFDATRPASRSNL